MHLFSLPDDLLQLLFSEWITLKELCIIDTSLCNHELRKQYLTLISKPYFTPKSLPNNYNCECIKWMCDRNIPISKFVFLISSVPCEQYLKIGTLKPEDNFFSSDFICIKNENKCKIFHIDKERYFTKFIQYALKYGLYSCSYNEIPNFTNKNDSPEFFILKTLSYEKAEDELKLDVFGPIEIIGIATNCNEDEIKNMFINFYTDFFC